MEIVYCHKCQSRLLSGDFDKGKAYRIRNIAVCAPCSTELLASLPEAEREAILHPRREPEPDRFLGPEPVSTPPSAFRSLPPGSGRSPAGTARRGGGAPARGLNPLILVGLLGAIVAVGAILLVALPSGRQNDLPSPDPRETSRPPDPPVPPPTPPVPPSETPADREKLALGFLKSARDLRAAQPGDFGSILSLYERCASVAEGTSVLVTARKEMAEVREQFLKKIAEDLAALEAKARPLWEKGDFKGAQEILSREQNRFGALEWTSGLRKKLDLVAEAAAKAFPALFAKAQEAHKRGAANDLASLRAQIASWGFPNLIEKFDRDLAVLPPPSDPTPPEEAATPALSKEGQAYHARWEKAAAFAAARDLAGAIRELEQALPALTEAPLKAESQADLETFRLVAALHAETAQILSKWPRGQNLPVVYVDETETRRTIDEPVYRNDLLRAEVRHPKGTAIVEFGEIVAASLADLFLSRPARKPETDLRAAAAVCFLEGDAPAAERLKAPAFPPRYGAYARKLAAAGTPQKESEARRLFAEGQAEARTYGGRVAAAERFTRLLKEFGDTAFVRRNLESIKGRQEAPKEFFFAPADIAAGGVFRLKRHSKGELAWTMEEEVTDKSRRASNFVDLVFSVAPDAEYRAWVYAGACCLEIFSFWVQGTDLTFVDPATKTAVAAEVGGGAAAPVVPKVYLKQTHVGHSKDAIKWEWVPLPVPKYASPGPKTLRIISDQEGFSVASAVVSATRKAPPTLPEARELEKARPVATPESEGTGRTGSILREWWTGINGDKVSDLTDNPAYPNKPTGKEPLALFEAPRDFADNLGTRIRGYVHPPATGPYTFWVAGDDGTELWLSTDESPANRQKVAFHTGAVGPRAWDSHASQKSQPIQLQMGRRYYVEALSKEGGGGDHLAAGWQIPGGALERPVPGSRLSPWSKGGMRPGIEIQTPVSGTTSPAPGTFTVTANVYGTTVSRIELLQGATKVADLRTTNPPVYAWSGVPAGSYPLTLRATEKTGGGVLHSSPVIVRVGEITFYRAINLNGSAETIDDVPWEGSDAPEYTRSGTGFERPEMEVRPWTDLVRAAMIRATIAGREGTRVSLTSVPPATYLVYVYTVHREDSQPFDLLVEGKPVVTAYRGLAAGDWMRHGPFTVEVNDGALDVQAARGTAHFSGIEVWRFGKAAPAPTEKARTPLVGGPGGGEFEDAREAGTFLVGFRYNVSSRPIVKSIQPIFRKGAEQSEGDRYGNAVGEMKEIAAKPGYAVGGLQAQGADRLSGFKIVFMRITGPVLNPKDSYESDWIGAHEGAEQRMVGDGSPVIGIHGRRGEDLDAFGLVYLK